MSSGRLLIALRRWREARAAMRRRPSPKAARAYSAACEQLQECADRVLGQEDAARSATLPGTVETARRRIAAEVGL